MSKGQQYPPTVPPPYPYGPPPPYLPPVQGYPIPNMQPQHPHYSYNPCAPPPPHPQAGYYAPPPPASNPEKSSSCGGLCTGLRKSLICDLYNCHVTKDDALALQQTLFGHVLLLPDGLLLKMKAIQRFRGKLAISS
ncbi:hypothetical protein CRG98_022794 [Punica granatum]|uniref:Uncharacterized protein n=1 Tax=Punica granatum TaxID=22663 RepID=A0A2I0JMU6_PUNGR|nr:hypothetical protein CRG98_022794 [Punica granatum]